MVLPLIFFYCVGKTPVQYSSGQNLHCYTACIISTENRVNLLEMFGLVLPPTEALCSSLVTEDLAKSFWKHLPTWNLGSVFSLQGNDYGSCWGLYNWEETEEDKHQYFSSLTGRFKGTGMCHLSFLYGGPCNFQSFIIYSSWKMQMCLQLS